MSFQHVNVPPPVNSYYEMLLSRFGRSSQESQHRDSARHMAIKEEAMHALELAQVGSSEKCDWDFWCRMISDTDKVLKTEKPLLKKSIAQGIPASLRGYVWKMTSKSHNNNGDLESEYKELLRRTSPHEKIIERDLPRSFPWSNFFDEKSSAQQQHSLMNVIKAYSLFDQQVGYCPELAYVIACLLLHMSEESTFSVLVRLMGQYGLRGHFTPYKEGLYEHMYQLDNILQQKFPEVHRHIETQGVNHSSYAAQWLSTMFAYRCSLPLAVAVLDLLFVEGIQALLQFSLALIDRNQATILSLSSEALTEFLVNGIFQVYGDYRQLFIEDASAIEISPRLLLRLSKQYAVDAVREARLHSQEEHMQRLNSELSEHVRKLEESYTSLEMEHQEVTRHAIETKMAMAGMDNQEQELRRMIAQLKSDSEAQIKKITEEYDAKTRALQEDKELLYSSNHTLKNQLEEVESALISLKMEYAERESEYQVTRRNLHTAQKKNGTVS
ncbi:rab-GTPase-TBC domain-containing protein [Spinellus fusiger]|nr:rab-GTPase-TBC domain-containing protein [Spinellus fusiger]